MSICSLDSLVLNVRGVLVLRISPGDVLHAIKIRKIS